MYYTGASLTATTTDTQVAFAPTLSGTGIFIGSPGGKGTATATIALSATAIAAGANDGSAGSTNSLTYYALTSVTGNTVGKYTIGWAIAGGYSGYVLIYVGSTSAYTVSGNFGDTADDGTNTVDPRNMTGSAGTITLSGDCYV